MGCEDGGEVRGGGGGVGFGGGEVVVGGGGGGRGVRKGLGIGGAVKSEIVERVEVLDED